MSTHKTKAKAKAKAKPAVKAKAKPQPKAKAKPAAPAKKAAVKPAPAVPVKKGASAKPAPAPPAAAGKGAAKLPAPGGKGAPKAAAVPGAPAGPGKKIPSPKTKAGRGGASKKASRRSTLYQRRMPNGEFLTPGDLLLAGGPLSAEEVHYFFRGTVAAEHAVPSHGVLEILAKRGYPENDPAKGELDKIAAVFAKRFDSGSIEALPPSRVSLTQRRTFQSVVDRAKQRRREIGAFLRGLHLGATETSHMDSHGEASLHNLMEWSARIENLIEAEEPRNADYTQFHRGLDHLDNTTEALMVDVELTLRRLRNRNAAR